MKKSVLGVLLGLLGLSLTVMAVEKSSIPDGMTLPEYNEKGHLVRPEGYREWVFVGASYGLSYTEGASDDKVFHHVYIQPEAYRQYRDEGTFPEKTMLAMENYLPASKVEPNLHGDFEDKLVGLEFAVKDKDNIKDGWGYFNFTNGKRPFRKAAGVFPKMVCFDCHAQHAKDDNVFVQFYPALKELKFGKSGKFEDEK